MFRIKERKTFTCKIESPKFNRLINQKRKLVNILYINRKQYDMEIHKGTIIKKKKKRKKNFNSWAMIYKM